MRRIGEQHPPFAAAISARLRAQSVGMEDDLSVGPETAAGHLDRVGETLGGAGRSIRSVGESLKEGGRAFAARIRAVMRGSGRR